MGITGLARLIADVAPGAIKEVELKAYFGRRIAIDASMSLYQFMIAIRHSNGVMTNEAGEATSHIVGFFYRTCKLLEMGLKPVYVFDGKAPSLKGGELIKRKERREEATKKLEEASGADVAKYTKRLVRVTRKHNDDCKELLRLMGLPIVESPGEAEAQCAELCKEGLVYGVATEDMDGLTFGAPRLIRNLSHGSQDKVKEFDLAKALEGLELTREQFIDLCILMGCDYCPSIKGVGPKTGLDLIRKHKTIEDILLEKYKISEYLDADVDYEEKIREDDDAKDEEENGVKDEKEKEDEPTKQENGSKDVKDEPLKEGTSTNGGDKKEIEDSEDVKDDSIKKESNGSPNGDADEGDSSDNFSAIKIKGRKSGAISDGSDDGESRESFPDIKTQKQQEVTTISGSEEEEDEEVREKSSKSAKKKKQQPKKTKNDAANVPANWLFRGARKLFVEPNVRRSEIKESDLKQRDVDEEGLIKFLCEEHGFNEDRVKSGINRIKAAKGKSSQSRIDSFFKTVPKEPSAKDNSSKDNKKKADAGGAKRKGTAASGAAGKRGRRPK